MTFAAPSNVGHDGPTRSEPVTPKAQPPSGDVERVVRAGGLSLVEWLRERVENCERIARDKTGNDRAAWLDDAAYYGAALAALRGAPAASGEEKS